MHESIVVCSAFTMSSARKFTFAISSADELLVFSAKVFVDAQHLRYYVLGLVERTSVKS